MIQSDCRLFKLSESPRLQMEGNFPRAYDIFYGDVMFLENIFHRTFIPHSGMSDPESGLFLHLIRFLLSWLNNNFFSAHSRRRRGVLRLSSQDLDGCDFDNEQGFDPPRCEGGRVVNNIQVTLNLEVCGCGGESKAKEQTERVANILTRVVKGGGGLVVCKQVDF